MKANKKGFTIIELGIVIVIIGILATFSISYLLNLREEAHILTLESDLSAAYKSALGFYAENPDDQVTLDLLEEHGYKPSEKVVLVIEDGFRDTLEITAAHPGVHGFYQVDQDGRISKK